MRWSQWAQDEHLRGTLVLLPTRSYSSIGGKDVNCRRDQKKMHVANELGDILDSRKSFVVWHSVLK